MKKRWMIPRGFFVEEIREVAPISDAVTELLEHKDRYTNAVKCGEYGIMKRHVLACPHCGHMVPAYFDDEDQFWVYATSKDIIEWGLGRLPILSEEDDEIWLNSYNVPKFYECFECGLSGAVIDERDLMDIDLGDELLVVKYGTDGVDEEIEFDFRTGETILRTKEKNNESWNSVRLTYDSQNWNSGPICHAILGNYIFREKLSAAFQFYWGAGKLPFDAEVSLPRDYVLMTRFKEMGRGFLAGIKWEKERDVAISGKEMLKVIRFNDRGPDLDGYKSGVVFRYLYNSKELYLLGKDINLTDIEPVREDRIYVGIYKKGKGIGLIAVDLENKTSHIVNDRKSNAVQTNDEISDILDLEATEGYIRWMIINRFNGYK